MENQRSNLQFKYYFYIILAGVCWGLTGTLQRLAPEGASSLTIGSVRMTGAGFLLLIYTLLRSGFTVFRRHWDWGGLLIAALAQVMYQLCFFSAVRLTGVALGTMIAVGTSPIIAGLLGRFLYREPLTGRWYFSTAVAVLGCSMLVLGNAAKDIRVDFLGCLLALGASVSYTFVGVGLRRIKGDDPLQAATLIFSLAGLAVLPLLVIDNTSWMASPHGISIVLVLSVVATILPMYFFAAGVQKIAFGRAYTLSLTEPLTASLLAVFLLGEKMSLISVLGAFLIFFSIYILSGLSK